MDYDVIIIGAGASGLMAAITAARIGSRVLVIEQKEKAGKKILATGNGKCNFTNLYQELECYRSDDPSFAMKVLSNFDVKATIRFFEELGIYPKERNGYLYPNSEQASSVVEVLLMECERLGVTMAYNNKVLEIKEPDFTVITEYKYIKEDQAAGKPVGNNKKPKNKTTGGSNQPDKITGTQQIIIERKQFRGKKLILAAGGCASPKLGSDGSGFRLAEGFGHTLIKPLPALVQLKSPDKYVKTISGVRVQAEIAAYEGNNILSRESGEIIFTDYGISGIPVMQVSRFVAKALDRKAKVHLLANFMPEVSYKDVTLMLQLRVKTNPQKNLEQMMIGLFNQKLNFVMIKEAMQDPYQPCNRLSSQDIEALAWQIKSFRMNISDTNSFENAQVCAGGISTTEINPDTMGSRLRRNLYFAGEIVDVDGTCGGYNLQWAWSSGFLAGHTK